MTNVRNLGVFDNSKSSQHSGIAIDEVDQHGDVVKKLAQIDGHIDFYKSQLLNHPIRAYLNDASISEEVLVEFAAIQFADSLLWVPMLALMKDKVSNARLKQALRENLLCEAGANATSHVEICKRFISSIGVDLDNIDFASIAGSQTIRSLAVTDLTEAQIAGWILSAETLVPVLFEIFAAGFKGRAEVDLTYLDEHISVDSDEHSKWMQESACELLKERDCFNEIISGLDIGARVVVRDVDALYAKANRKRIIGSSAAIIYSQQDEKVA